jgi:hypothetical protein
MHDMPASDSYGVHTAHSTPVCGEVERGVQMVCIAFGEIHADLDGLT